METDLTKAEQTSGLWVQGGWTPHPTGFCPCHCSCMLAWEAATDCRRPVETLADLGWSVYIYL